MYVIQTREGHYVQGNGELTKEKDQALLFQKLSHAKAFAQTYHRIYPKKGCRIMQREGGKETVLLVFDPQPLEDW